jgi:biopolymer transport protein ExbD
MRFLVRKHRQTPAVIIVALIDVLIVLLIFLMITTTFKQQQPALRLALPESSQAQKTGASENAPLVVSIDTNGILHFGPDARSVTVEQLTTELKEKISANPQLQVAINADKAAPFGQIVKVMDIAKSVGIKNPVAAFTKEGRP